MLKRIVVCTIALCFAVSAFADYISDREVAMALVRAKKDAEALSAFVKMAEGADLDAQKADALEQAAMCAHRMKNFDTAMELAKRIPVEAASKTVQMRLLQGNRKRQEVIERFKDEDFSVWPEKYAGDAFFIRGECYFSLKNGRAAEADLKRALENLGMGSNRDYARLTLAHNYRTNLQDDEKALELYLEGVEKSRDAYGWIRLTCITSAADILRRQGKTDEALQTLDRAKMDKPKGYWGVAFRQAYAEVYAAQGKKEEAVARMKQALETEGISAWQKNAIEKRLKELED